MRGDALLRNAVHALGADLELQWRVQRAHQRGVQRLISRCPWGRHGPETARLRLVELVQYPERRVALQLLLGRDAKAEMSLICAKVGDFSFILL